MAKALNILTVLTASQAAKFEKAVEASASLTVTSGNFAVNLGRSDVQDLYATNISSSGYLKAGGALDVIGASSLYGAVQIQNTLSASGQVDLAAALNVDGAVDFDSTLDVAGAAVFHSSLSASGPVNIEGALNVDGAADLDSTLAVAGNATLEASASVAGDLAVTGAAVFQSSLSASGPVNIAGALNVDGATDLDGALDVAGAAVFQASASIAGDLAVTGAASVGGNLTVTGDLVVNGTTTTINSTTLTVDDKNIELASTASPSDTSADGAGITVKGTTDKTFNWVDANDAWTSSENMDLASGKKYMISAATVVEVSGGEVKVGGAADVRMAQKLSVEGSTQLSSSVYISGSAFSTTAVQTAAARDAGTGMYALDPVLKALETAGSGMQAAYNAHRYMFDGSLSTGAATVTLAPSGPAAAFFTANDIKKIALDVLVSSDAGATWTNDLVAVSLKASGAALVVDIDAPGLNGVADAKYRLIAVNEGSI